MKYCIFRGHSVVERDDSISRCPSGDKFSAVHGFGIDFGVCCKANLGGAVWGDGKPVCSAGISLTEPADNVERCGPKENMINIGGLEVCVPTHDKVKRDEQCCPGNDKWFEVKANETTYGTCCGPNLFTAIWANGTYGPRCCDGKGCKAKPTNVESCPSGWKKQFYNGMEVLCKKE